ncbi:MAG: DNA polymerase III subunit chi [Gammaproteobacteria bacterium]|nr:DNA polymerase III subunit chi [Gammaproteobacteria bacterium]MCI0591088.1 DNA polymerase III subunit chi [Gammaproteobacteria bacterium]
MAHVDFYILDNNGTEHRKRCACALAGKAWHEGHRVYIHASSAEEADAMDQLLWTYNDIAFLPHERVRGDGKSDIPILVGCGEHPPSRADVMINLSHPVPPFFSRFAKIIELVDDEATGRELARDRYRFYREHGQTLQTHTLNQNHG